MSTAAYVALWNFVGIKLRLYLRLAVWLLVHAFVVPHVERHPADFAFETDLVPYLQAAETSREYSTRGLRHFIQ